MALKVNKVKNVGNKAVTGTHTSAMPAEPVMPIDAGKKGKTSSKVKTLMNQKGKVSLDPMAKVRAARDK